MRTDDALIPGARDTLESPTALRTFFFREASASTTRAATIEWWERRRLPFNLAVGAAGMASIAAINVISLIGPDGRSFFPPLIAVGAYAVLANIMYTGGWVTELALRPLLGRKTPVVGATIFRYGFVFSVGLTLLPIVVASIDLGVRVLRWLGSVSG